MQHGRARRVPAVPAHALVFLLALLVAGCGGGHTSSVFNSAAPLPPDVTVWYRVGDFNRQGPIGLKALKGRDGSDAWVAATGEYRTPAEGFPVQVGEVIYTEGSLTQGGPGVLSAVRATDGHILWQVPLPFPNTDHAADLTMAADSTTLLLSDRNSGLYALDTETGKVRWHVDGPGVGTFVRQIAVGDGVAVALAPGTTDGAVRLVAYGEVSGKLLWSGPEYGSSIGLSLGVNSHAVYIVPNDAASSTSSGLIAYDPHTGHELWQVATIGGIVTITDQSVLLGGAYLNNGNKGTIACFDAVTGALTWQAAGNYGQWYELSASQTAVYVPTTSNPTQLSAISLATGKQLWRIDVSGNLPGAVVEEDGVAFAFLGGVQNDLGPNTPSRLAALNAQTGAVYWERDLPDNY